MWKPERKRPVGRLRKRWMEGVEAALGNRGTSVQEVVNSMRYDNKRDCREFLRGSLTDRQKCLPGILVRKVRKSYRVYLASISSKFSRIYFKSPFFEVCSLLLQYQFSDFSKNVFVVQTKHFQTTIGIACDQ